MLNIEIPKEKLDQWEQMTDENQHIEVRVEIAKYLQSHESSFEIFVLLFEAMRKLVRERGYMNASSHDTVNELAVSITLTRQMFHAIEYIFGTEIKEQINACL